MQTLRRQVQRSRDRRVKQDAAYVQELQLQRLIGKGGFGTVYVGTWQGSPVAVKVRWLGTSRQRGTRHTAGSPGVEALLVTRPCLP